MDLFFDMIWIWIFGLTPVILSIVFGVYWLRNERFPWEKRNYNDEVSTKEVSR